MLHLTLLRRKLAERKVSREDSEAWGENLVRKLAEGGIEI